MNLLDEILSLPTSNIKDFGYLIIAIVTTIETMPLVGVFFPGIITIATAGVLTKMGFFNLYIVILIVSIFAFIGDLISYLLGIKLGRKFLIKYSHKTKINSKRIEKIEKAIITHSGKSLILGKFHGLTRGVTPFIAGSINLNKKTLLIYSSISSIIWAITLVMLGFFAGTSVEFILEIIDKTFLTIISALIFIGVITFIIHKKYISKIFEKNEPSPSDDK